MPIEYSVQYENAFKLNLNDLFGDNDLSYKKSFQYYNQSPTLRSIVNKIVSTMKTIKVFEKSQGELIESIFFNSKVFKEILERYATEYLITGNAICLQEKLLDRKEKMIFVSMQEAEEIESTYQDLSNCRINLYNVSKDEGNIGFVYDKDSKYFEEVGKRLIIAKNGVPKNASSYLSSNFLKPIQSSIRIQILAFEINEIQLKNHGATKAIFYKTSEEEESTRDGLIATLKNFTNLFNKNKNAGKTPIITGEDAKVLDFGLKNNEIQFDVLMRKTEETIANYFSFPLAMMSTQSMTLDNYKESKYSFYTECVLPFFQDILNAFGDAFDKELTYNMSTIDVFKSIEEKQAVELYNSGIIELNEAREKIGYEPLKNNGAIENDEDEENETEEA